MTFRFHTQVMSQENNLGGKFLSRETKFLFSENPGTSLEKLRGFFCCDIT